MSASDKAEEEAALFVSNVEAAILLAIKEANKRHGINVSFQSGEVREGGAAGTILVSVADRLTPTMTRKESKRRASELKHERHAARKAEKARLRGELKGATNDDGNTPRARGFSFWHRKKPVTRSSSRTETETSVEETVDVKTNPLLNKAKLDLTDGPALDALVDRQKSRDDLMLDNTPPTSVYRVSREDASSGEEDAESVLSRSRQKFAEQLVSRRKSDQELMLARALAGLTAPPLTTIDDTTDPIDKMRRDRLQSLAIARAKHREEEDRELEAALAAIDSLTEDEPSRPEKRKSSSELTTTIIKQLQSPVEHDPAAEARRERLQSLAQSRKQYKVDEERILAESLAVIDNLSLSSRRNSVVHFIMPPPPPMPAPGSEADALPEDPADVARRERVLQLARSRSKKREAEDKLIAEALSILDSLSEDAPLAESSTDGHDVKQEDPADSIRRNRLLNLSRMRSKHRAEEEKLLADALAVLDAL